MTIGAKELAEFAERIENLEAEYLNANRHEKTIKFYSMISGLKEALTILGFEVTHDRLNRVKIFNAAKDYNKRRIHFLSGKGKYYPFKGKNVNYLISEDGKLYAECFLPDGVSWDYGYNTLVLFLKQEMRKQNVPLSLYEFPYDDSFEFDPDADADCDFYMDIFPEKNYNSGYEHGPKITDGKKTIVLHMTEIDCGDFEKTHSIDSRASFARFISHFKTRSDYSTDTFTVRSVDELIEQLECWKFGLGKYKDVREGMPGFRPEDRVYEIETL